MKRLIFITALILLINSTAWAEECTELKDCNIQLLQIENQLMSVQLDFVRYQIQENTRANIEKIDQLKQSTAVKNPVD